MTVDEVKARLQNIADLSGDAERAHGKEDDLLWDFVTFISQSDSPHAPIATEILKSMDIVFSRWCA